MSAIVIIPILIPAASASWPVIAAAAVAAASALGYSAADTGGGVDESAGESVEISVENSEEVAAGLACGEEMSFKKGDVDITFTRGNDGKFAIRVHGTGKSKEELKQIGENFSSGITQQYVYNRLMQEIEDKDFNLIDQEIEEDGTVRLHVRTYQS